MCNFLEQWIASYPSDFAATGAYGALHAVVKHLLSYPHTISYGCEFQPFLDSLGSINDEDAVWALKSDDSISVESDVEADSTLDADLKTCDINEYSPVSIRPQPDRIVVPETTSNPRPVPRDRRSSLPLSAMSLFKAPILAALHNEERNRLSMKEVVSRLQRTASVLSNYEADAIADEVTRRELELFLKIEVRASFIFRARFLMFHLAP